MEMETSTGILTHSQGLDLATPFEMTVTLKKRWMGRQKDGENGLLEDGRMGLLGDCRG